MVIFLLFGLCWNIHSSIILSDASRDNEGGFGRRSGGGFNKDSNGGEGTCVTPNSIYDSLFDRV